MRLKNGKEKIVLIISHTGLLKWLLLQRGRNGSLSAHSAYRTFDEFKKKYYTYGDKTTNYADVFASEKEMASIQAAIDKFLEEKAYRNYTE